MRKRLFVAINLDARTKAAISKLVHEAQAKMPPEFLRGTRFAPPENWHLTLSFLGYQNDDDLRRIVNAAQILAAKFTAQEIVFRKMVYGPPSRGSSPLRRGEGPSGRRPRMIWLLTDEIAEKSLSEIKTALEDELEKSGVPFRRERRPFTGHLTLARFPQIAKNNLPTIERDLRVAFAAESLDLMESKLKRSGAEYAVLQKFQFKN